MLLDPTSEPHKRKKIARLPENSFSPLGTIPIQERDMRRSVPNSYSIPGFDTAQISNSLEDLFRGEGGAVEQTGLYIDPSSGSSWYAVENQPDYAEARAGRHYKDIAQHIHHHFLKGINSFDLFALGSGGGSNETRLTQCLLTHINPINLFFLDVSQPLLNIAFNHARNVLGTSMKDYIATIPVHIPQLSQGAYVYLYHPQLPGTRRMISMLGYTFGNMDTELLFVRNHLAGFAQKDLLLLDVVLGFAPADKPEEIQKKDPRLTHAHSPGWDSAYEEFLSNTIRRYCQRVKHIQFFQELDYSSCSVPGSYAIAVRAKVLTDD